MKKETVGPRMLYLVLWLSGFAGLGYEMVWTRMLSTGLGHEIIAVLAVVGAFFCGMALGAWCLDGVVSRSPRPGNWYAALELAIGLWSIALIFLLPSANRWAASLIGIDPSLVRHWSVAFVLPFFLLLPATFAMGATLPAMERLFSRLRRDGWSVGGLYAANTFGAVAGVLLTTFLIAPQIGFRATAGLLAATNFVCAFSVFLGPARGEARRPPVASKEAEPGSVRRVLATLFVTGILGIGYEVLVIRVVSQVLENTVFSFAALLSVYLLGTATGGALYQALAPRAKFESVLAWLLEGTAIFCLIGVALLPLSESIFSWTRAAAGGGVHAAIAGELGLALGIFFLPTAAMGATFSHLAQAARGQASGLGRALCVNTLGASAAPLVFGVLLLPELGSKLSLLAVSAGYMLLVPPRQWRRWAPAAVPLGIAAALWFHSAGFNFIKLEPNSRIAVHIEGVMAAVTVIEDSRHDYFLKVNNKFLMGGTASRFSDGRQGHIPLLLHPNPRRTLFLGLGTGATYAAAAGHPGLAADGVELVPEVVRVLPFFQKATGPLDRYAQLRIHVADARRFVNASREAYDVIVADLFHPARDGAGFLYTAEHFGAIRARLAPGGVFCQWLPLYQMDLDVLRTIMRTFLHVFPNGAGFLATYSLQTPIVGLIAAKEPLEFPPDYFNSRIMSDRLRESLPLYRLQDLYSLIGCFLGAAGELAKLAGNGPLNTDDHPVVIFQAPRFAYRENEPASARLLELVDHLHPSPRDILRIPKTLDEGQTTERLAAYWRARDKFLHAGIGIRQTADVKEMLQQVRSPLMAIVRESPDFEAAYTPLLAMAQRLFPIDPAAAEGLLIELENANPYRAEAVQLRKNLEKGTMR